MPLNKSPESKSPRHQPLKIAARLQRSLELRNRVIVPPMASETADSDGFATAETLAHYARLAESGVGLVMVEYTFVAREGRSEPRQLGASTDAHVEGLSRIAARIHESGARAGLQLTHAGGKSERALAQGALWAPSAVAVPVKDRDMETPDAMGAREIEAWKDEFSAAATRAVRAGFDLVELHSAHGYGLNQWLSLLTNRREDAYGGSLENRARLLLEIVARLRCENPNLVLAVRMPGQDFLDGGLTRADMAAVARWLVAAGVDLLDVSSGIGGWRRPRDRRGEGYLVDEARAIQSAVEVPVIGVGGIETGEYVDAVVSSETGAPGPAIALAAVGRAILKDPQGWGRRVLGTNAPIPT